MRADQVYFLMSICFILLGLSMCEASPKHNEETQPPLHFSSDTFIDRVKDSEWLILFYSCNCSASLSFLPVFKEFSVSFEDSVNTGMIDW